MSDIVHEMTLYAKRDPEPYVRWAGEVIELKQRISELESVLCRVSVAGPTSRLPTALLTDIKELLEPPR